MRWYSNTPIKSRFDGKRVYQTTTYPDVRPSDNDVIVVAGEADYLDTLAFKYYGDPTLWRVLAWVNNIGKGRLSIDPGTTLRIPTNINEIIDKFNRANAQR